MSRITKRSYKRKVILFGLLIFMSIALISTGFAAWIMSTNAEATKPGNVSVGIVEGGVLEFSDVELDNQDFLFEPASGDTTGRVKAETDDEGNTINTESLTVKLTAKISPVEDVETIKYVLVIPESVQKAADAGYIVLPTGASVDAQVKTVLDSTKYASGEFEITFEFKWGTKFGGVNPSLYYDEAGKTIPNAEVKKELENFRAILYGYYEAEFYFNAEGEIENPSSGEAPKYSLKSLDSNDELTAEQIAAYREKIIEYKKDSEKLAFDINIYANSKY